MLTYVFHDCRITVNFSMQLTHIIRETRYLDRMTFTIPEYALNVTLQEDRYLQCVDGLTDMLERYYKVCPACAYKQSFPAACELLMLRQTCFGCSACQCICAPWTTVVMYVPAASHAAIFLVMPVLHECTMQLHMAETRHAVQVLDRLTSIEQQLLSQRLTQLRHVLDPGFSPLNWNSLGIPDFVATCNKVSCSFAQQCFCFMTCEAQFVLSAAVLVQVMLRMWKQCVNFPHFLGLSPRQKRACRQSMSSSLS